MVVEEGNGSFVIYWGGDRHMRNGAVYNAEEWPLDPEANFAGGNPPTYEFYGPMETWSSAWNERLSTWTTIRRRLGLQMPIFASDDNARSLRIPIPVVFGIAMAAMVFKRKHRRYRGRQNSTECTQGRANDTLKVTSTFLTLPHCSVK
jgi:hypothetical protein